MKKIFKSYGFWTALAGAVVVLLNSLGRCFGFTIDNQLVSDVIMAVAGVLVVFGVVTMPSKEEESEDKPLESDDTIIDTSEKSQSEENEDEQ